MEVLLPEGQIRGCDFISAFFFSGEAIDFHFSEDNNALFSVADSVESKS